MWSTDNREASMTQFRMLAGWRWLALAGILWASRPAAAQQPVTVWVNLNSGVYHCFGTEYYGNTVRGEYLPEPLAGSRGHRPAQGRRCAEAPAERSAAPPLVGGAGAPSRPANLSETCEITRIADGDTFDCGEIGQVRVTGIDTPERGQEPFLTASTAAFAALAPVGTRVLLEFDTGRRDQYNRTLAYVWLPDGGPMLNWMLVRQGFAVSWRFPPNVRYADVLLAAESAAKAERRGLWHTDGFRCLPLGGRAGC